MYPKHHILIGLLVSLSVLLVYPSTPAIPLLFFFFSSFLIDIDHYFVYLIKEKNFNIKKSFYWHKQFREGNKFHKPMLHIFHTIEFHIFILIVSFFFPIFLFIFLGIFFHSLIDLLDLIIAKRVHAREYFLIRYLIRGKKNYF